jgi:hypothetical protein
MQHFWQADAEVRSQAVRLRAVYEDGSSQYLALDVLTNSEVLRIRMPPTTVLI